MARFSLNTKARSRPTVSSFWLTARRRFVHLAPVVPARVAPEQVLQAQVVRVPGQPQAVRHVPALPVQVLVLVGRELVVPVRVRRARVVPAGLRAAGVLAGLPAVEPWEMVARRSSRPSPG